MSATQATFFLVIGAVVAGNLLTIWFVLSLRTYRLERKANRPAPYWAIFGVFFFGLLVLVATSTVASAILTPML